MKSEIQHSLRFVETPPQTPAQTPAQSPAQTPAQLHSGLHRLSRYQMDDKLMGDVGESSII